AVCDRAAEVVPCGVDSGGVAPEVGRGQGDGPLDEGQGVEDLTDAPHACPSAAGAERHVGADPCGEPEVVDAGPAEHGGGVCGAAPEPATVGDALVDGDVSRPAHGPERPGHEVVVAGGQAGGRRT